MRAPTVSAPCLRRASLLVAGLILVAAVSIVLGPSRAFAQAQLGGWQSTSALNLPRYYHEVVAANGYVYAIGGESSGTWTATVEYAQVQPDGSLGPWQYTASMNSPRFTPAAAVAGGWIYVLGGGPDVFSLGSSERAQIQPDGSLGPWQLAGNLARPRYNSVAVATSAYVYALGGSPLFGGIIADVERAAIQPDGSLGPWQLTTSLPAGRTLHGGTSSGTHVYLVGGAEQNGGYDSVIFAPILNDGSLGAWTATSNTTRDRFWPGVAALDGSLYVVGGLGGTQAQCADVEVAGIQPDGSLGPFAATAGMSSTRCYAESVATATHLYAIGGYGGSPAQDYLSSVEVATPIVPCPDGDGDTVCDDIDTCPTVPNLDQNPAACAPGCIVVQRGVGGTVEDSYLTAGNGNWAPGAYSWMETGGSGPGRALVQFDVSGVPPGAFVTTATVTLYVSWNASFTTIRVHEVLDAWSEATVSYPSFWGAQHFSAAVEASFPGDGVGLKSFDITSLAGEWVSGSSPNHGVLLEEDIGAVPGDHMFLGSEAGTVSQRPKLEICYAF